MFEREDERVRGFLDSLRVALGERGGDAGVVDEVRADLESHIASHRDAGASDDEAITRALDEMGNPYELAHNVRTELPPFGGKALTVVRYVLAAAVLAWTLVLLWALRPGAYGFQPTILALIALLHFPVVLLLWPRIVWRKNWLFGVGPALVGLTIVFGFMLTGTSSTSHSQPLLLHEEGAPVTPVVPTIEAEPDRSPAHGIALGLAAVSFGLLMSMQRRSQRRAALFALLATVTIVEVVFQTEEAMFRSDLTEIRELLDERLASSGPFTEEWRGSGELIGRADLDIHLTASGESYVVRWNRPLSPGHAIVYSSAGDEPIWVQD